MKQQARLSICDTKEPECCAPLLRLNSDSGQNRQQCHFVGAQTVQAYLNSTARPKFTHRSQSLHNFKTYVRAHKATADVSPSPESAVCRGLHLSTVLGTAPRGHVTFSDDT